MSMRDPKEWASWIIAKSPLNEAFDEDFFARLIREAQEDGARHAACPHCGPGTDLNTALNQLADERVAVGWAKEAAARLEAQVAALTERAERAEGENDRLTGAIRMVSATVRVRNKGMRQDVEDYYFLGACEEYADEALEGKDVRSDFTMGILVVEALSDETSKP